MKPYSVLNLEPGAVRPMPVAAVQTMTEEMKQVEKEETNQ